MQDIELVSLKRLIESGVYSDSKNWINGYGSALMPNNWIRDNKYSVIGQIDFNDCD